MKTTNIQIFTSDQFGEIRTCQVNDQIMFVGSDVAKALGYSAPRNAIATHVDKEDKTTAPIQCTGSNYKSQVVVINESGLYSLILSSKLEQAKAFKRWVTSEVLPALRRTGRYAMGPKELQLLGELADYCQEVLLSVDCLTMTQVAKDNGMSVHELTRLLLQRGIIYSQSGGYMLYADYARQGLAKTRTDAHRGRDGRRHTTLRLVWTERGRQFVHTVVELERAADEHLNLIEFC